MKHLFIALFLWLSLLPGKSQDNYLIGYQNEVSGTKFTYHSPLSNSYKSLLSRANKDFEPIVWHTQVVPADYRGENISFVWLYAMDVTPTPQAFDLYLNDIKLGTFHSPVTTEINSWIFKGELGTLLTFNQTMVDRHGDQMGFAVLTMPVKNIQRGEALRLKVDAVDNDSPIWYMTFKVPLKQDISVSQLGVVAKEKNDLKHTVRFNIIHLGDSVATTLTVAGQKKKTRLVPGLNEIDFTLKAVTKPTTFTAKVEIKNRPASYHPFTMAPVRQWTINLVQHSHTDIGYTRSQTEILAEHLRFIDYALDYCDQTDHYPDDAKFRWTCEASWTVREYLKARPQAQIDRLLKRIKEGRIEVTGMFFNFSEIVDETALAIQTQTLKYFKDQGIDVTTAMQNDVNGIGWCMVDLFHDTGVKYLTMGQHGHRAQIPFDKPTAFWWESPAGNRLLAYRSEHYMHGNALSLTSGNIDVFRANLSDYLKQLDQKKYPFDQTSFQFSGYVTDNSPPSTTACDIVKAWNEKYEWPKLRISLASEFMVFLEKNEANQLAVQKVAWPDWWTDGFGSAMNETKAARTTQAEMISNLGLFAMARMMGATLPAQIDADIRDCYDNLLFYDEHTLGADESITNPLSENVLVQWGQKAAYAWTAVKQSGLLREKALGYLQPFMEKAEVPTIAVFNTLNWSRSGLISVYIDHDILPLDKNFTITDDKTRPVPAHLTKSRNDGSYWSLWVPEIPPMGHTTLRIQVDRSSTRSVKAMTGPAPSLENNFYKITIDPKTGTITGIYDKELGQELVDPESEYPLGTVIYEELDNRHTMERLTNTNRDTTYVPLKKQLHYLKNAEVSKVTAEALWNSLKIHGSLDKCSDERGLDMEIRLYHHEKKIELLYRTHKLKVTTPEALYVAFPFKMTATDQLAFEVQGGTVRPGRDQLEGTASDWNTIQNFATVKNEKAQIIFTSKSTPLVQFGDINTGRFYYKHIPARPHIYSWVLNNYWTTNFKANQEGEMNWNYLITSTPNTSNTAATRFGWENTIPLAARVIPSGTEKKMTPSRSLLNLDVPNLLLVDAKPSLDGKGIVLHLRETEGDHAILDVARLKSETGATTIREVSVLEEEIKPLDRPLLIEHFETKFIYLGF
ncbi:MAG: glycosyl hydrolase family 38 [Saprospiraceae bacterium]|nr:glycosyl hydrolase family 38 [Saprospiraceae bacterium]